MNHGQRVYAVHLMQGLISSVDFPDFVKGGES